MSGTRRGEPEAKSLPCRACLPRWRTPKQGNEVYLLTGDQSYLAPYRQATALIESELYRLEGFQKGDRLLQANFLPLQRHIHAKLSELRQTIGLCQNADTSSARKIVLEGTGQREMGSIRSLILTLLTEQNHKLDQLQRDYQTSTSRSNRLLAGGIGIQFLLLVLVFVFFYRDATNRFRSAREMQRAHARLDAILSTMSDGVYQVDRSGKLLYLSPAGEQLLGYSLREIEGVGMHNLIHAHSPGGEYRPADQCPLSEVMRSGVFPISSLRTAMIGLGARMDRSLRWNMPAFQCARARK